MPITVVANNKISIRWNTKNGTILLQVNRATYGNACVLKCGHQVLNIG